MSRSRTDARLRKQEGFTLLEVIVALAILAIVLSAAFELFATGLNSSRTLDAYIRATLLAQTKLERIGADEPLRIGAYSGQFEGGFLWRVDVADHPVDDPALRSRDMPRLYEVVISVTWDESSELRTVVLETLRLGAP